MMQKHLNQVRHNDHFHQCIVEKFDRLFHDWRITVLFYTAFHCLKALAAKISEEGQHKGKPPIDLGKNHVATAKAIGSHGNMPIKEHARRAYIGLLDASYKARYDGLENPEDFVEDMKRDYEFNLIRLQTFKQYIIERGVPLPNTTMATEQA